MDADLAPRQKAMQSAGSCGMPENVVVKGIMTKEVDRGVAAPVAALTLRETQCLELVARGLRNEAIASELAIAPVTVEKHLAHARARLGALTREHAVALALKAGLIRL